MIRRILSVLVKGLGRTERRVVSAIVVTALIPLLVQLFLGRAVIAQILATAFEPEFETHLDQSLGVYADLAKSIKREFHVEGRSLALELGRETKQTALDGRLAELMIEYPELASAEVIGADDAVIARRRRPEPLDETKERTLVLEEKIESAKEDDAAAPLMLHAIFATPRARFDEMDAAQQFAQEYHVLAAKHHEGGLMQTYAKLNIVVLVFTIFLAIVAGVLVVRPVTRRIGRLAAATLPVAEGDLSVRFADPGDDEVGDLGRAFNHMLEELEQSHARIEFLRRMSEWQKVARRLAHEIKNPLTPIQLAVEECHRRYTGDDPAYKRIVETTLEVVEEEVGTLRRLVGEFSSFARLPKAELREGDLAEFLRAERGHLVPEGDGASESAEGEAALLRKIDLVFTIPSEPMPTVMDREMLHRVLGNLVKNAAQALRDAGRGRESSARGRVTVTAASAGESHVIDVDDDGPGIDPALVDHVFDPYVTTKRDGTGLGLSIVKKIIVDHGGTIEASRSPLGGARFHIRVPRAGTAAARAALERVEAKESGEDASPPSGRF